MDKDIFLNIWNKEDSADDLYGDGSYGLKDSPFQKDMVTPWMKKENELFLEFGDREKLLTRPVYYLPDFRDDRIMTEIVRGPKGTFYLNPNLIPAGVEVQRAYFSYMMGGELTASFMSMYICVEGDDTGDSSLTKQYREFDDSATAREVYNYLRANNRNVSLEGNKIYIKGDLFTSNREINEFMDKYRSKMDEYTSYIQNRDKTPPKAQVKDDDVFGL